MCTNMIFLGFVSILFLVKKHYLNTLVSINLNFLKIYLYFLFICIFWYFVVSYFIHYTILLKFCMIHLSYILPSFAVGFVEYFPRHKHVFVCRRWRVGQICFSLMRRLVLDCFVTCLAMKIVSISGAINSRCCCKCDCDDGVCGQPLGIWTFATRPAMLDY